ncbi:maleylpyruvate isomerase family mycothiol-dependent enzyme [Nocardia inohanensis]|uniref:maleylpyruvate isomerase family mycothiol-dependent enzyme n=1 Tax=Nocardia inohanensis TaxID=209246 RepID=UPI00082A3F3F|nr:maleylpyruvate isomerase family mycothiol-dependent enzyme [Nocardia inohanensis]
MSEYEALHDEQIWQAVRAERVTLVEMLAGLTERQWDEPSLCGEWRVREVVAHIVLSTTPNIASILFNLIRARGNLDRTIRDTAIRLAARTTTGELLAELRAGIDARVTVIGTTPADRLMDLLVHGQDIALPLGIPREMPLPAARSAIDRIWSTGAPFHVRERLAGKRLVATDIDWSAGDGPAVVTGPISALLLLSTGREQAWRQLTGA